MDVYCTIDSPDIRSYLQEIRYQFTIEEAAYLVWQCRRVTLEEKFAAWEEIVDTMPDSAIIGRPFGGRERVDSGPPISPGLHSVQKQRLVEFSQPGRWVYTAQFFHEKSAQWSDLGHFFTIYQDCLDACQEAIQENSHWLGKIAEVETFSLSLDDPKHRPWELELTRNCALLIHQSQRIRRNRRGVPQLLAEYSHPFPPGGYCVGPIRTAGIPPRGKIGALRAERVYQLGQKGYAGKTDFPLRRPSSRRKIYLTTMKARDTSDMHAWGYSYQLRTGLHLEYDRYGNYLNLEYYRQPLRGIYQTLQPLSQYVKHCVERNRLAVRMEGDLQKALSGRSTTSAVKCEIGGTVWISQNSQFQRHSRTSASNGLFVRRSDRRLPGVAVP